MAASRIVWTPVPAGREGGRLKLSVLVSPRLTGSAPTLAGYPEWLDWPAQRPRYSLVFGAGPAVAAEVTGPAPRSDLWRQLFPGTTPVVAAPAATAAAVTVPPIRSWPPVSARDLARSEHAAATAFQATAPLSVNRMASRGPGLAEGVRNGGGRQDLVTDIPIPPARLARARTLIAEALARDGYFLGGPLEDPESPFDPFSAAQIDFLLARQFHHREAADNPSPGGGSLAAHITRIAAGDPVDFHAALGALAQYPALQRTLGLVVDLVVDAGAPGVPAAGDPVAVALRVEWPPLAPGGGYEAVLPAVNAVLTAAGFAAKPTGTLVRNGLLRLDSDRFEVVEVDADGTADALSGFGQKLLDRDDGSSGPAVSPDGALPIAVDPGREPAPLPSHRADSIGVVQRGRARELRARLVRATDRAAAPAVLLADEPFGAEELEYGIRVDVWDDTTRGWLSLCRRSGTYDCGELRFEARDEGTVHLAHTTAADGDPTIYLHESIFAWDGYSLAASRPGSITRIVDGQEVTTGPDTDPTGPVRLRTSFRALSLPKLRYGRGYRFRARIVDITGNGLGPNDPAPDDFGAATPLVRHLRFEPVGSPDLLPAAPRTQGESLALLVIRGNYSAPATGFCERRIVPRRISPATAERHGMYDVTPTPVNPGGMDRPAYSEIVRRDTAGFTGGGEDPGGWGDTPYFDRPLLEVPYLPDVLARGAAFRGLPGLPPDEVFPVAFDDRLSWPRRAPFTLRLENGSGAPEYDRVRRVLTVRLPPGRSADVVCSSRIDEGDLDVLGIWQWFADSGLTPPPGTTVDDLRGLAAQGQLWQLTPRRPLRLTHAVRQPVTPAAFGKPIAVRVPGDTFARIVDVLTLDRASTAKVDFRAEWTEPGDAPVDPAPVVRSGRAHLTTLATAPDDPDGDRLRLDARHEFHDTRHRTVTYTAVAATRFGDFFTETARAVLTGTDPVVIAPGGFASGTLTVLNPADGRVYDPAEYEADPATGAIRRSGPGSAIPDGGTVEAGFVTGPVTRVNTEAQRPVVVDVRSSARPTAPDVAYLVPTFGWERAGGGTDITSTRRGNGIRVYLRRPWYSSGDSEELGVVLAVDGAPPPALRPWITLRGQDALFASAPTAAAPGAAEFPLATRTATGLVLAESETVPELPRVAVAAHAVGYDEARRLWYCDLTMPPEPAYRPFLRFAFARYQRHSLSGLELSPVVLAQFAQLNPDRTLSVALGAADPARATVTVSGPTYAGDPARGARLTLLLQTAVPGRSGALGWRTEAESPLPPVPGGGGEWGAVVTLPGPPGSTPMRLLVEEREVLPTAGSRLVYADAVEI
ncbi:hypothetical protein [Streptomyces qinzhouensis]|uniref:Uncharacterized protein n=1 Tax=Streptomyces qinzhouensis TaxID=2599401 RepID=A0A5B8J6V4_9ACTN|nr:hypothetical protein [Streptomyces qinzhouensis]QDY75701.1 hypothetical protein FQU76_03305 [Streptomyces qinzhouensis]